MPQAESHGVPAELIEALTPTESLNALAASGVTPDPGGSGIGVGAELGTEDGDVDGDGPGCL